MNPNAINSYNGIPIINSGDFVPSSPTILQEVKSPVVDADPLLSNQVFPIIEPAE